LTWLREKKKKRGNALDVGGKYNLGPVVVACRRRVGSYCTFDEHLAVFSFEPLLQLRPRRLAVQRLLVVGAARVREVGGRVVGQEFARLLDAVERQLLMDERERDRFISVRAPSAHGGQKGGN
jgi:hypothetical protein